MRGLFCDNYCGFKTSPPPTGHKGFPLGTLTFSDEKASMLSKKKLCESMLPKKSRPPEYFITLMLLKAESTAESSASLQAVNIMKTTYNAVFPDFPFHEDASPRCISDTLLAASLESSSSMQKQIGEALSCALTQSPFDFSRAGESVH